MAVSNPTQAPSSIARDDARDETWQPQDAEDWAGVGFGMTGVLEALDRALYMLGLSRLAQPGVFWSVPIQQLDRTIVAAREQAAQLRARAYVLADEANH